MTEQVQEIQERSPKLSDETITRYMAVFDDILNPKPKEPLVVAREHDSVMSVNKANELLGQYFSDDNGVLKGDISSVFPELVKESVRSQTPTFGNVTVRVAFDSKNGLSFEQRRNLMYRDPDPDPSVYRVIELRRYLLSEKGTYAGCDVCALRLFTDSTSILGRYFEYGGGVVLGYSFQAVEVASRAADEEQVDDFTSVVAKIMNLESVDVVQ